MQILLRCSWSHDGRKVAAGSADRFVNIWDTTSRHILYKLPGHNGSVNTVEFHPKEPIGKLRIVKPFPFLIPCLFQLCPFQMTKWCI